jgi:cell division septation protein DedD
MPFVLLVLTLLGGSLICLLVINTTLGAASFRISQLQKTGAGLATQLQGVRQRVAAERAPAEIAQRAYQLGMRTPTNVSVLDLRTDQIYVLDGQSGVGVQLGASPASSTAAKKPAAASTSAAATSTPTPATSAAPTPTPSSTPTPAGSSR